MKNTYQKLIAITVITLLSFGVNAQSKFDPIPEKPDTYKVTKTINLEYKYVPSIKELIENGTFIPADPNEFKKVGPPKRMRGGTKIMSVVTVDSASDLVADEVCGVAVYDMQDKVSKTEKCDSILIKGVVDVLLSDADIREIKTNNLPQISLLRRFHKVGSKTLCRCFVNFNTSFELIFNP